MSNTYELTIAQPLSEVKSRLDNSRKEMAPQISTCKLLPDAKSLVCTISYGNAYASINARETEDGKGTLASVELIGLKVWRNLLVIVCVLIVTEILSLNGLIPILHLAQWLGMATIAIGWTIGSLIMVSISKKVLKKYISETLIEKA